MIKDVAALLTAFQQKEIEAIERSGITHAPTIGAQYEGITGSILKMMIPPELELQVVSGFVEGVDGLLSGQIDGMLVRGSGTPIPGVQGQYKWPIKHVLAVLEVKKTLFGSDLADAHDQFQSVMALFWAYAKIIKPSDGIDISAPRYVYSQISGEAAPVGKQFDDLPLDKTALYRMLLDDHVAPVRIILGYGGFKTEHSLRQGFLNFLAQNPKRPGFAGSSLPSLIVCGKNSIVKTNGQPFYFQPWQGRYLCYASSSHSPILWILNLILTRISHLYASPDWYSRDLSIDRFAPLLWGKAADKGDFQAWEYWEHPVSAKDLKQVPALTKEEWQPIQISQNQAVLLALIGNNGITKSDAVAEMSSIDVTEEQTLTLIDDLIAKRLLGWDRETLVFLTRCCSTVFTPKDGIVAHDMEDERFAEWMARAERWNKSVSVTS
ncbi:MAG: DUF6602 domain-containing protein [Acidobacteriaceae bacterium]